MHAYCISTKWFKLQIRYSCFSFPVFLVSACRTENIEGTKNAELAHDTFSVLMITHFL